MVLESRTMDNGMVRRRRKCKVCGERFPTRETYAEKRYAKTRAVNKVQAKPREEKKIPPKAAKVEGKRRPDWPEYEPNPSEELNDIFNPGTTFGTGTPFRRDDE